MESIQIFVSTYLRPRETKACISALHKTTGERARIHVYDQSPHVPDRDDRRFRLMESSQGYLLEALQKDIIGRLVFNGRLAQEVYWSKNLAWAQFLQHVSGMPSQARRYLVMVDNDTLPIAEWIEPCIEALESDRAQDAGVEIISPYDGRPYHELDGGISNNKTGHVADLGSVPCYLRTAISSRFWVMRSEFALSLLPEDPETDISIPVHDISVSAQDKGRVLYEVAGPSPYRAIIGGKIDRVPTDLWYWRRLKALGKKIGVFYTPVVTDPDFEWRSARRMACVGSDFDPTLPRRTERIKDCADQVHKRLGDENH